MNFQRLVVIYGAAGAAAAAGATAAGTAGAAGAAAAGAAAAAAATPAAAAAVGRASGVFPGSGLCNLQLLPNTYGMKIQGNTQAWNYSQH